MTDELPRRKPTYSSAMRVAELVHNLHIRPAGLRLDEIQDRFGISERTMFRYLGVLRDLLVDSEGEPMLQRMRRDGHPVLRLHERERKISGEAYELMGLYLALDLMQFLNGTNIHEGIRDVLDQIQDQLLRSSGNRFLFKDFKRKFYHKTEAPKNYSPQQELIERIVSALVDQRRIEIRYIRARSSSTKKHALIPLTLLMYKRGLYLVGQKDDKRRLTFAVERITKVKVLEERYHYPPDYDPNDQFGFGLVRSGDPVPIRLKFDALVAPNVRGRDWHSSQRITELASGDIVLELYTELGNELSGWILSYGPYVEVLKPLPLREEIEGKLRDALARYDK